MEIKKIKCKDCKYYKKLEPTQGLCSCFVPQDRVHCDSSCKNAKKK